MSEAEIRGKFDDNAGDMLSADERRRLADAVARTDSLTDASELVRLAVRTGRSR
jgi:hypothetical protein